MIARTQASEVINSHDDRNGSSLMPVGEVVVRERLKTKSETV